MLKLQLRVARAGAGERTERNWDSLGSWTLQLLSSVLALSLAVLLLLEKFSLTTSTESRPSSLLQNRTPTLTQTSPLPSHKERICSRLRLRIRMKKAVETAGRSTQRVCSGCYLTICSLTDRTLSDLTSGRSPIAGSVYTINTRRRGKQASAITHSVSGEMDVCPDKETAL